MELDHSTLYTADDRTDEPAEEFDLQGAFLHLIAQGCNDEQAARGVGKSRWAPWRWKKDPEFLARYNEAKRVRLENLVAEAERRAMKGSDKLLMFLMCNYAPDKFNMRQQIEHSGGVNLTVATGVPTPGDDLV